MPGLLAGSSGRGDVGGRDVESAVDGPEAGMLSVAELPTGTGLGGKLSLLGSGRDAKGILEGEVVVVEMGRVQILLDSVGLMVNCPGIF